MDGGGVSSGLGADVVGELVLDVSKAGEAEGGIEATSCGEPCTAAARRTRWEIHERSVDRMVSGRERC
jgi:hypothetical protein